MTNGPNEPSLWAPDSSDMLLLVSCRDLSWIHLLFILRPRLINTFLNVLIWERVTQSTGLTSLWNINISLGLSGLLKACFLISHSSQFQVWQLFIQRNIESFFSHFSFPQIIDPVINGDHSLVLISTFSVLYVLTSYLLQLLVAEWFWWSMYVIYYRISD